MIQQEDINTQRYIDQINIKANTLTNKLNIQEDDLRVNIGNLDTKINDQNQLLLEIE